MPDIMKRYDAFVMPTLRETYGLVYIEALFAGVPVLLSKGRGIDGYFKAGDIGYACDPQDVQDIAAGIEHLLTHEAALKKRIEAMQAHGEFSAVRRGHIIEMYRQGLNRVLEQK